MAGDDQNGTDRNGDGAALSRAERVRRQAEERQSRLAGALRANLHRRKSQSRGRDEAEVGDGDAGRAAGADPGGPGRSGTD